MARETLDPRAVFERALPPRKPNVTARVEVAHRKEELLQNPSYLGLGDLSEAERRDLPVLPSPPLWAELSEEDSRLEFSAYLYLEGADESTLPLIEVGPDPARALRKLSKMPSATPWADDIMELAVGFLTKKLFA